MSEYNTNDVGYVCEQCGCNYLTRRPWRFRFCIPCWRERLPVSIAMILLGVAVGYGVTTAAGWLLGV